MKNDKKTKCWFNYIVYIIIWLTLVIESFNGLKITIVLTCSLIAACLLLLLSLFGILLVSHKVKCENKSSS